MNVDDAVRAMQTLGSTATEPEIRESLRESLARLSHRVDGFVVLNPPPFVFDDCNHPRIHPSRVGDPPAHGCDAAPNRKPKPWESVRWQPRKKH